MIYYGERIIHLKLSVMHSDIVIEFKYFMSRNIGRKPDCLVGMSQYMHHYLLIFLFCSVNTTFIRHLGMVIWCWLKSAGSIIVCDTQEPFPSPEPCVFDAWVTAFKWVSVSDCQLGADLIDTYRKLPSSAFSNCRHDSLSLSMKTTGFCKHMTVLMALHHLSVIQFCAAVCFHAFIFSVLKPNGHFTLMSSPFNKTQAAVRYEVQGYNCWLRVLTMFTKGRQ